MAPFLRQARALGVTAMVEPSTVGIGRRWRPQGSDDRFVQLVLDALKAGLTDRLLLSQDLIGYDPRSPEAAIRSLIRIWPKSSYRSSVQRASTRRHSAPLPRTTRGVCLDERERSRPTRTRWRAGARADEPIRGELALLDLE
jgi:hypothetical protein